MDFEATSAEMTEVADPSEEPIETDETGEEDLEVAEPESYDVSEDTERTEADAAFAEMRRAREAAERKAAEAEAALEELRMQQTARQSAYSRLTGREEGGDIAALAELTGMSEDEIISEMEAAEIDAQKDLRIDQLEKQVMDIQTERMMQEGLAKIQKLDPTISSLRDLPPEFGSYIAAGLSEEDAYWAIKAKEAASKAKPPKAMGKVAAGTAEKEKFTEAEIDAMSSDQLRSNWKKIFSSWG